MSDIQRNLVINFIARGAGQVRATIQEINSGLLGMNRQMTEGSTRTGILTQQLRSLGTTVRYALSGFAVYGFMGAVQNLQTLQESLGSIAAIGETIQGTPLPTDQLNKMRDDILRISTDIASPAEEIANSITTIYSSMQGLSPRQVENLAKVFTVLERTTRTGTPQNVQEVGTGLLRTLTSFGIPTGRAPQTANQIFKFIQRSIGVSGEQFAQFTAPSFRGAQLAGVNFPQFLALSVLMQRGGGTFALNQRWLGQLFRNIRNPPKGEQKGFSAIGLTPETLSTMSFNQILQTIFEQLRQKGGAFLPPGEAAGLQPGEMPSIKGPAAQWLGQLVRRAETRGAIVTLFQQWMGQGPTRPGFTQLNQEFINAGKNSKAMGDAMKRNLEQIPITRIQQSWRNFFTSLLTESDPVLKRFADLSQHATDFALKGHRHRREILGGAAIAGGLLFGRRFLPNVSPFRLFGAGSAALSAAQAIASGDQTRGASPLNPVWVAISYQMGGPRGFGPLGRDAEKEAERHPGFFSRAFGFARRTAGRVGGALGGITMRTLGLGLGTTALAVGDIIALLSTPGAQGPITDPRHPLYSALTKNRREFGRILGPASGIRSAVRHGFINPELGRSELIENRIFRDLRRGFISPDTAERRLRAFATSRQLSAAGVDRLQVSWNPDSVMKIELTGKDLEDLQKGKKVGKPAKFKGATSDTLSQFRFSYPLSGGQQKVTRK